MKTLVGTGLVVAIFVFFIVLIALFVGEGMFTDEAETPEEEISEIVEEERREDEEAEEPMRQEPDDEEELVGFEADPQEVNDQNACQQEVRAEAAARDEDYYAGRVIVSFPERTTRQEAVSAVEALGYRPDNEQVKQYNANYFFTAYVEEGGEVEAVCELRDLPEVQNAVLDYKLDFVL